MKKIFAIIAIFVLILSGCGSSKPTEGEKEFRVEVVYEGDTTLHELKTSQDYLGDALLELGLAEGEQDPIFGLDIKKIDGIRADYDLDKAYWAFYVDGDYAMSGVSATPVEDGKTYAFIYTEA
ncbi:MAG: DUF4430 domain-containing protein [Oscillospiraceae bacterium]|nr:DUF4430 domain-containing protein [Oscillospiraceae bacterium]